MHKEKWHQPGRRRIEDAYGEAPPPPTCGGGLVPSAAIGEPIIISTIITNSFWVPATHYHQHYHQLWNVISTYSLFNFNRFSESHHLSHIWLKRERANLAWVLSFAYLSFISGSLPWCSFTFACLPWFSMVANFTMDGEVQPCCRFWHKDRTDAGAVCVERTLHQAHQKDVQSGWSFWQ